ncbi:MAG: CaiB/BaiF CoA transferase family protein [Burkholderiales bacterium]
MTALPKKTYTPGAGGTLDGVRVLDLSRLICGNTITQLLADFGAEVIKVETGAGDTLRAWKTEGVEINWKFYARNKKSLALDLHQPEARDLLLRMLPDCAVFIESFRPGTLEEMGLGPDVLLARNPRLVIVRISGWGQDGPYRRRPGFGSIIEGMSGFAAMNGFPDREPVLPPTYLADSVAGLYGATAVMIALREAEQKSGRGQVIDLSLLEPLFVTLGPYAARHRLTGAAKPRMGSRSANSAPRNVYRCRDGKYVGLVASIQKMAERLLRAIGRPELVTDPRFSTNSARVKNAAALDDIIGAFIAARTQAEAVAFFEQAEVTVGPIYDIAQIVEDPQVIDRALVADYPDPDMGEYPMYHVVPRLSVTPGSIRTPAPRLGEHNRALLRELGIDEAAYAQLVAAKVVTEESDASPDE